MKKKFKEILEEQKLADLSQFYKDDFCDEAPLYSRYSQISFLSQDVEKANIELLNFGLQFLDKVIKNHTPFFAAITIWKWADNEPILPCIFVCNNDRDIRQKLNLHKPKSAFSKKISKLVSSDKYVVWEDNQDLDDGGCRIFIEHKSSPH